MSFMKYTVFSGQLSSSGRFSFAAGLGSSPVKASSTGNGACAVMGGKLDALSAGCVRTARQATKREKMPAITIARYMKTSVPQTAISAVATAGTTVPESDHEKSRRAYHSGF